MYVAVGDDEGVLVRVLLGVSDDDCVLVGVNDCVLVGVLLGVSEDVSVGVLVGVSDDVSIGVLVGVGLAEAVVLFEATPLSICCEIATDCATDARELIAPAA